MRGRERRYYIEDEGGRKERHQGWEKNNIKGGRELDWDYEHIDQTNCKLYIHLK